MKTFFTPNERDELKDLYLSTIKDTLNVFKMDSENLSRNLKTNALGFDKGIEIIDRNLTEADPDVLVGLQEPENREKMLDFIKGWLSVPELKFSTAAIYLSDILEFKPENDNMGWIDEENLVDEQKLFSVGQHLDRILGDAKLASGMSELNNRFPLMFSRHQYNNVLINDQEALKSMRPAFNFLNRLSFEDIAQGNIDYLELFEANRIYTPFTPTLLTLADMRKMELPEGHAYFPLVNGCFSRSKKFDFKGVVKVIPQSTFDAVTSIDPRVYQVGTLGVDFKNFLTSTLMTDKNGAQIAENLCGLVKERDYGHLELQIHKNLLMNIGMLTLDKTLLLETNDEKRFKDLLTNPLGAVKESLRRTTRSSYFSIKESSLEQAAKEVFDTGFLVKFREMRSEQGTYDINSIPHVKNPGMLLLDPLGSNSIFFPTIYMYAECTENDLTKILKKGPRDMHGGKKFYHENKEFLDKFKEGGLDAVAEDPAKLMEVVDGIYEGMQDKKFKDFIKITTDGLSSAGPGLLKGIVDNGLMRYFSLRNSDRVLVKEINRAVQGDYLMGYAMNNCLSVMELLRYTSNPDARLYCMWMDGKKVGMSYDLLISQPGRSNSEDGEKDPLIDSIEFSDDFYKAMHKRYGTTSRKRVPNVLFAKMFVNGYLTSRAQHSERGIYVLPESNDFLVKSAIMDFIEDNNGQPVLSYQGNRVNTDTDFRKMPYWVSKEEVMKGMGTTIFNSGGEAVSPDSPGSFLGTDADSPLSEEATELLNEQFGRLI